MERGFDLFYPIKIRAVLNIYYCSTFRFFLLLENISKLKTFIINQIITK